MEKVNMNMDVREELRKEIERLEKELQIYRTLLALAEGKFPQSQGGPTSGAAPAAARVPGEAVKPAAATMTSTSTPTSTPKPTSVPTPAPAAAVTAAPPAPAAATAPAQPRVPAETLTQAQAQTQTQPQAKPPAEPPAPRTHIQRYKLFYKDREPLADVEVYENEMIITPLIDAPNVPPFSSFFIEKVLGEMRDKDENLRAEGMIDPDAVISWDVDEKDGLIRQVVIRNIGYDAYTKRTRAREISSAMRWTLSRIKERGSAHAKGRGGNEEEGEEEEGGVEEEGEEEEEEVEGEGKGGGEY
jgi:hypothetical protein